MDGASNVVIDLSVIWYNLGIDGSDFFCMIFILITFSGKVAQTVKQAK